MSTQENILINIREDGARVVVVNINAIANASANASQSVYGLTRMLGTFSALSIAKKFFEMADAVVLLDARLKLATKSTDEFNRAQADIYKMSQQNNVGLRETTRLYTKLAEPVRNMGGGMKEVTGIVDAFGTALRVGGANTQEAAAATLQFAQAMNKGKLDGDEFRTMAEVAPRVMRAMAEGMNVPVGQLKEMSKQGLLTSDVIANSLLSQLKKLKEEAASMGDTVGGAFSDLTNDTLIAVGAFDKMSGSSAGMSDIIKGVSLIVFELAQVFRDEIKDGTDQADRSFQTTGVIIKGLGTVLETLLVLGSDVSHIFKTIGRNLGGFAAQVVALLRGDLGAVSAIQDSLIAENKTALDELDRYQGRIIGMTDRALAVRQKLKDAGPEQYDTNFAQLGNGPATAEKDLMNVRMKLAGITQDYYKQLNTLQKMHESGALPTKEYTALVSDLAKKTYESSVAGKEAIKTGAARARALNVEENAFKTLKTAIAEKIGASKLEMQGNDKLTESQKLTNRLNAEIAEGKSKLSAQSIKTIRELIGELSDQEDATKAVTDAITLKELATKAAIKADYDSYEALRKGTADIQTQIDKMREQVETYGMVEQAVSNLALTKAEAALAAGPASYAELIALDTQIAKLKELESLSSRKDQLDIAKKAAKETQSEWKKATESIEGYILEALMRGFEGGKSFGRNLIDTLKNMFKTLILKPTIQGVLAPITGSLGGIGQTVGQSGGPVGGLGNLMNLGSMLTGGGLANSLGTGFMGSVYGGMTGAGAGSGLTSAAGLALGEGLGSIGSALSAASPYLLAIGAAVAIWKKLDTSGTLHTGGGSSSSAFGTSTVSGGSANFQPIQISAETEKLTAALSSGIVGILDSTATAFGKTAGYTAATAFADDTSKDGAWGALLINKMGEKIVDWQDSRTSRWAPKEFADGKEGQEQYIAALAGSVRSALDAMGLPNWATKMLNDLGNAPTIEELQKVVGAINETQTALSIMGKKLVGFAQLSESATESLIIAAGGIEKLATGASAYYDAFYNEAEKMSTSTQQVSDALKAVGIQMPATREAYRAEVEAKLKLGEAGAPAVAALLASAGAFASLVPATIAATEVIEAIAAGKDILAERVDLQREYDELTMTSTELLAQQRVGIDASNLSLFDSIAAIKANEVAEKKRQDALTISNSLLDLQMQAYQASGDKIGIALTLQKQHTAALEATDPALRDAVQNLWNIQAAAESVANVKSDGAQLISAVDDAFAVLQTAINKEKQLKTEAYEADLKALQEKINKETAAVDKQKAITTTAINNYKALSDAIQGTLNSMKVSGDVSGERKSAQASVREALARAKSGGGLPDANALKGPLSTLAEDSAEMFGSMKDYYRDFYRTQLDLKELGSITDNALSVEEQTLKVLEDQKTAFDLQKEVLLSQHQIEMRKYDDMLAATQMGIDKLKGIDSSGLTIIQLLETVRLAIVTAGQNSVNASAAAINEAYKTELGRTPEKAGMDYWQDAVAKGGSIESVVKAISGSMEAQIQDLYQKLLGRSADAAGLDFFLKSGSSISAIYQNIVDSNEYKQRLGMLQSPAASTGMGAPTQTIAYGSDSKSSAQVEILLNDLIEEVRSGNGWTAQMADHIDNATDGGNGMRVDIVNNSGAVKLS